jgi:L-ribulose-5-phosphate 4-epimerase
MFEDIKTEVCKQNIRLKEENLVILTWGNASAYVDVEKLVVIKPSGVKYSEMVPEKMVVTNLDGDIVEGSLNPSTDLLTHLEIYKNFPNIGGIVHTHSKFATSWAQARRSIPLLGTTHADYSDEEIHCVELISAEQIDDGYEKNTGKIIVEFLKTKIPENIPGLLVPGHGVFCFGKTINEAVENSIAIENIAEMAYYTLNLNHNIKRLEKHITNKHFYRKHGDKAYYGQKKG